MLRCGWGAEIDGHADIDLLSGGFAVDLGREAAELAHAIDDALVLHRHLYGFPLD